MDTKGAPNKNGIVEIGYEVCQEFRNQGFATSITHLLVKQAFEHQEVKIIQAHTLAKINASVKVLQKNKFFFKEAIEDSEQSAIWRWELKKSNKINLNVKN